MDFDFDKKMKVIFEGIEDEANPDPYELDLYDDEDTNAEAEAEAEVEVDKSDSVFDSPSSGRSFDDLKLIYGPPKTNDGRLADTTVQRVGVDSDGRAQYERVGAEGVEVITPEEYNRSENKKAYVGTDFDDNGNPTKFVKKVALPTGEITDARLEGLPQSIRDQYTEVGETGKGKKTYRRSFKGRDIENEWIGTEDDKWYFSDVVEAMMPSIVHLANKYKGKKYNMSDAMNDAILGISHMWMRDLGKSAFTSRAWEAMQAAIRDGLNAAVMGKKSEGGTRKLYDQSVSIDAPTGGEGDETFASGLAAPSDEEESGDKALLITRILMDPDVGLNDRQQLVMRAKFGIGKDGKPNQKGPMSTSEIADIIKTSEVSVRNNYKKALAKIQNYMASKGVESEEGAMSQYQIENKMIIKAMFKVLAEMARIEMAMISETQEVKIQVPVNGVMRNAVAIVITDSLEVDNIIAENNESVMMYAGRDVMREAVSGAKYLVSEEYFSEMANSIIGMYTQPVLAVIGIEPEQVELDGRNKAVINKIIKTAQKSIL